MNDHPFYLSHLRLNPTDRRVRRELGDVYELHRTVMSGFPPQLPAGERVLFRLDEDRAGRHTLLVQSRTAPDWGDLAAGYLLPVDPFHEPDNPAVKAVAPALPAGQILRFRLRANPTVKLVRRDEQGRSLNSNRVPLVHEDKQRQWLAAKAGQSGFRVLAANVSDPRAQKGWKRKGEPPLTLFSVQFDGHLQITDAAAFQKALAAGIGPARGFGCGLLSLAPA